MRIENVNGRNLMCGYIYPLAELAIGQEWAPADGTDRVVIIREIEGSTIRYSDNLNDMLYEKDQFEFQARYCKVV